MHGLSGGRWPALGNPMRHLRPDTDEGGEPQGSGNGRPRNPLEGRGKQAHESAERKHNEALNSKSYVYRHQQNS
jgi:hypothetical protein